MKKSEKLEYLSLLTSKQAELYDVLLDYYKKNFRTPTLAELIRITGKAKSTLSEMLKRMEEKGCIKVKKYQNRGIRLILEENFNDECIYFCQNDSKKETNDKYGLSKGYKSSRRSIWK